MHNVKEMLTKQESIIAKGYLAIIVFLHHAILYSSCLMDTIIFKIFSLGGFLAVSAFFFLSGYGLSVSSKRDRTYIDTMVKNRVFVIYLNYLICVFCYIVLYLIIKRDISFELLVQSFLFGKTIVFGGWYIQALILFYLFY